MCRMWRTLARCLSHIIREAVKGYLQNNAARDIAVTLNSKDLKHPKTDLWRN